MERNVKNNKLIKKDNMVRLSSALGKEYWLNRKSYMFPISYSTPKDAIATNITNTIARFDIFKILIGFKNCY